MVSKVLEELIKELKRKSFEHRAKIWKDIAERLETPRKNRAEVNVGKIARYTKPNDMVIVPGKVLGGGEINHPVIVAALSFSKKAKYKIEKAGGKCLKILELVELNPKGSNVKIMR